MDVTLIFIWVGLCVAVGIFAARYGRSAFRLVQPINAPVAAVGVALVLALGRRA
jgi:hypothetical protein